MTQQRLFRGSRDNRPAKRCELRRGRSTLQDRFDSFHLANPHVYREIRRRAVAAMHGGEKRIAVKWIVECIRKDKSIQSDGRPYRFDNSFTALYARILVRDVPELDRLIELRG